MTDEQAMNSNEIKSVTRTTGRKWSFKTNKDRFFYPEEWLLVYDSLEKNTYKKADEKYYPLTRQQLTMILLLHTGARINEAKHIKVEDIDLDNKRLILKVTKTKAKKGETVGKPRIIPISDKLVSVIKRWIKQKNLQGNDYLGILSTPAVAISIKNACKKAGIKDYNNFSAHNFRKTLEVWLMSLGVADLKLVAHIGHDLRTAATHYVSPDIFTPQEKMMIRDILGDLYRRQEIY